MLREGNQRSHSVIPSQEILQMRRDGGQMSARQGQMWESLTTKGHCKGVFLDWTVLYLECGGSYINLYV